MCDNLENGKPDNIENLGTLLRMALRISMQERQKMTAYFLEMALIDLESELKE